MKKASGIILVIIIAIMVLFSFTACPNDNGNTGSNGNSGSGNSGSSVLSPSTSGILVAYFSCTYTTKGIAEFIKDETKGTLYEIVPKIPYTADDLKYYTNCRADKEQADAKARPAIDGGVENFDKYGVIFLGYPIWHGQAPRIISTFLESYDFSGKTIVPFCTSHSSDIGSSDTNLRALAPSAEWLSGKRFASGASPNEVKNWIASLDLKSLLDKPEQTDDEEITKVYLTINSNKLQITLAKNSSVDALVERLKDGDITYTASDYGGFEKVGGLGFSLPTDNTNITTQPGDVVLYLGNQIVLFYGSNNWSYTRLGRIEGYTSSQLQSLFGNGNVKVTLSIK